MQQLTSKAWWLAAGTRAIKTAAEAALSLLIFDGLGIFDVDWQVVAASAALAAVYALVSCLAGLPEVPADD